MSYTVLPGPALKIPADKQSHSGTYRSSIVPEVYNCVVLIRLLETSTVLQYTEYLAVFDPTPEHNRHLTVAIA